MPKTKMVIRNVDDCIDRFWDDKLFLPFDKQFALMQKCFPRLTVRNFFGTGVRYITAKMASCHHPDANGYVYAHSFVNKNAESHPFEYVDNQPDAAIDKIGSTINVKTRLTALKNEVRRIHPDMQFNYTIAIFPLARSGASAYLEEVIQNSLRSYHREGEYFESCLGVWNALLRWHLACFAFEDDGAYYEERRILPTVNEQRVGRKKAVSC